MGELLQIALRWAFLLILIFRVSLPLKQVTDMNKLMERVEEYKRLEDDQLQDKAKAKLPMPKKKGVRMDQSSRPQRDFFLQV